MRVLICEECLAEQTATARTASTRAAQRAAAESLVRHLTSRNTSSHQRSLAQDRRSPAPVATQSATHFDLDLAASRKHQIQTRRPSARQSFPARQQASSARHPSPAGPCPHRRNLATGTAPVQTAQGQSPADCTRSCMKVVRCSAGSSCSAAHIHAQIRDQRSSLRRVLSRCAPPCRLRAAGSCATRVGSRAQINSSGRLPPPGAAASEASTR